MTINYTNARVSEYSLESEIGRGGMSRVYRAIRPDSGQVFAVKIVNRQTTDTEHFERRFSREIKALSRMAHPAILPLLDSGREEDGTLFMVMPLVEDGTLRDFLDDHSVLTPAQARQLVIQIGDALDYAHSQGIVHRDIKPHNIMMMGDGKVSLADFGIAAITNIEGTAATLTATGETLGTIAYMSPEQIRGDFIDGRADLYAFGIVMYQALVGRLPFAAENTGALLSQQLYALPIAPQLIDPNFPPWVELVLDKALAKNPEDRYQTGAELASAFDQAFEKLPPETLNLPLMTTDNLPQSNRLINIQIPEQVDPPPQKKIPGKRIPLLMLAVLFLLISLCTAFLIPLGVYVARNQSSSLAGTPSFGASSEVDLSGSAGKVPVTAVRSPSTVSTASPTGVPDEPDGQWNRAQSPDRSTLSGR